MRATIAFSVLISMGADVPWVHYRPEFQKVLESGLSKRIGRLKREAARHPEKAAAVKAEIERLEKERPLPRLAKHRRLRNGEWGVYEGELLGVVPTDDGWIVRETVAYTKRVILKGVRPVEGVFSMDCPLVVTGYGPDTEEYGGRLIPVLEPFPIWRLMKCPGPWELRNMGNRFSWERKGE